AALRPRGNSSSMVSAPAARASASRPASDVTTATWSAPPAPSEAASTSRNIASANARRSPGGSTGASRVLANSSCLAAIRITRTGYLYNLTNARIQRELRRARERLTLFPRWLQHDPYIFPSLARSLPNRKARQSWRYLIDEQDAKLNSPDRGNDPGRRDDPDSGGMPSQDGRGFSCRRRHGNAGDEARRRGKVIPGGDEARGERSAHPYRARKSLHIRAQTGRR